MKPNPPPAVSTRPLTASDLERRIADADGLPGVSSEDPARFVANPTGRDTQSAEQSRRILGLHVNAATGPVPASPKGAISGAMLTRPVVSVDERRYQLGPSGVVGVVGEHPIPGVSAYFYRVPVGNDQYALIDSGADAGGGEIRNLERDVHDERPDKLSAVLLTHGHIDHTGGARSGWKNEQGSPIPVFVGQQDIAECLDTARFQESEERWWFRLAGLLMSPPSKGVQHVEGISEGDVRKVGNATFHAVALPGHSAGSVGWVWQEGKIAFVGDAVSLDKDVLTRLPAWQNSNNAKADASVAKLVNVLKKLHSTGVEVKWLATGHDGFVRIPDGLLAGPLSKP